jgi:hypothetical protein
VPYLNCDSGYLKSEIIAKEKKTISLGFFKNEDISRGHANECGTFRVEPPAPDFCKQQKKKIMKVSGLLMFLVVKQFLITVV